MRLSFDPMRVRKSEAGASPIETGMLGSSCCRHSPCLASHVGLESDWNDPKLARAGRSAPMAGSSNEPRDLIAASFDTASPLAPRPGPRLANWIVGVSVVAGETIPIDLMFSVVPGPYVLYAEMGTVTNLAEHRWLWTAPAVPARCHLVIADRAMIDVVVIDICVMTPAGDSERLQAALSPILRSRASSNESDPAHRSADRESSASWRKFAPPIQAGRSNHFTIGTGRS